MNTRILAWTYFDCTPTGIRGNFKSPMGSSDQWIFGRNQQRNWETIQQCVALRCQPLNLSAPVMDQSDTHKRWWFTFEVDRDEIFAKENDSLALLKQDCQGVPMIAGLTESWKESFLVPYLVTQGPAQNLFFEFITAK